MKSHKSVQMVFTIMVLLFVLCACSVSGSTENTKDPPSKNASEEIQNNEILDSPGEPVSVVTPSELIAPEDLVYLGAFRLPDGPDEIGWDWGGDALTYYPDGDPNGSDDGFSGSLFGTGHNWNQYVSEISIPAPVISASKNPADLNTAETLQDFQDIRAGLFDYLEFEIPRVGLEYLPPQSGQDTGKLHFAWGQHYQLNDVDVTHGWAELDLSNPQTAGAWRLADFNSYSTNDYLFSIPPEWAELYTPGKLLATGRFRDGGWSGMGPNLFAYGPWNEGSPPAPGTSLGAVPLLMYGSTLDDLEGPTMDNYHHSDEWSGGAWLTTGDISAVIFAGTKGVGEYWYGFANGVVWPEEGPWPDVPPYPYDARGWWSTSFEAQIIFYDPADLAAVAIGQIESHEPQPYAVLNSDEFIFNYQSEEWWRGHYIGGIAYDRENGLLFVLELFGDEDKPIVHVWQVE